MNITTTDINDITKEIDELESTIPDEEVDVSTPIEQSNTLAEEPIEELEPKTENEQLREIKDAVIEVLTEETPQEVKPIDWTTQLYAVDAIEDIYDRAYITMILLGESARGMYDNNDPFHYTPDHLHVALRNSDKAHFDRTLHGMGDAWREQPVYEDNTMSFERNGVKIVVETVDNVALPYFNNPDKRLFQLRDLALPNPYPAYIKEYDNQ